MRVSRVQAIARGVFGVPTAAAGEHLFWGVDATDMLLAFLKGDAFFSSETYQHAYQLPSGQQRT